jgi:hypothetical protein
VFFRGSMKYLSIVLITLALSFTLLANSGFENADSAQLIASAISLFLAPFHTASTGAIAEATPFYLVDKNSTYILIAFGVFLCIVASALEINKVLKFGKNQKSAGIIALSVCLLYFNASIFAWNT